MIYEEPKRNIVTADGVVQWWRNGLSELEVAGLNPACANFVAGLNPSCADFVKFVETCWKKVEGAVVCAADGQPFP